MHCINRSNWNLPGEKIGKNLHIDPPEAYIPRMNGNGFCKLPGEAMNCSNCVAG